MHFLQLSLAITTSVFISTTIAQTFSQPATIITAAPTPAPTGAAPAKYQGCFDITDPLMYHGDYIYQSEGNCVGVCLSLKQTVLGLGNGTSCWCGNFLPPASAKVDDSKCDTPCAGYPQQPYNCGSLNALSIWSTGFTLGLVANVDHDGSSSQSSSASATTATITQASTESATSKPSGGSSVGIAVGVVVAVVAICGIAGAAFFFWRRQKQQKEMQEYQKQSDITSFVAGASPPGTDQPRPSMWAPDQRLGTNSTNRMSNGSIADNEDFSRRILQVRNPDGF